MFFREYDENQIAFLVGVKWKFLSKITHWYGGPVVLDNELVTKVLSIIVVLRCTNSLHGSDVTISEMFRLILHKRWHVGVELFEKYQQDRISNLWIQNRRYFDNNRFSIRSIKNWFIHKQ